MPRRPMNYLNRGDIPNYGFDTSYNAEQPYGSTGVGMGWDVPSYYDTGATGQPQAWHPDMLGGNAPYTPSNYGSGMALGQSPYTPSYGIGGDGTTPITPGGSFFGSDYSGSSGNLATLAGASQAFGGLYEHARTGLGGGSNGNYFGGVNPYSSTQSYLETGAPGYSGVQNENQLENYGSYRATQGEDGAIYNADTGVGAPSLFYGGGGHGGTQEVDPWSSYFSTEDIGAQLAPGETPGYGQAWSELISNSIGSTNVAQSDAESRASAYLSMPSSMGNAGMNLESKINPELVRGATNMDALKGLPGSTALMNPFFEGLQTDEYAKAMPNFKNYVRERFHDIPEDIDLSTYGKTYDTGERKGIETVLDDLRLGASGPEAQRKDLAAILGGKVGDLHTAMLSTGQGIIPSELEARTEIQSQEAGDIGAFDAEREEMIGDASSGAGFLGEREERWQDYIEDYNKQVKRGKKDVKESKTDLADAEEDIEADLAALRAETLPSRRKIRGFEGGGLRSGRRSRVGEEERTKLNLERTELERQRSKAIDIARREQKDTRNEFGREAEDLDALRNQETEQAEAEIIEEGPILAEDKLGGITERREQMTGETGGMSVPKALHALDEMFTNPGQINDILAERKSYYDPASESGQDYRGSMEQQLAGSQVGGMMDTIIGDTGSGGRKGHVSAIQGQFGPDKQFDMSEALTPDWFGSGEGGYNSGSKQGIREKKGFLSKSQPFTMFGEKYSPVAQYSNSGQAALDVGWQDEARPGYARTGAWGGGWANPTRRTVDPWWNFFNNSKNKYDKIPQWTAGGWGDVDTAGGKGYAVVPHGQASTRWRSEMKDANTKDWW